MGWAAARTGCPWRAEIGEPTTPCASPQDPELQPAAMPPRARLQGAAVSPSAVSTRGPCTSGWATAGSTGRSWSPLSFARCPLRPPYIHAHLAPSFARWSRKSIRLRVSHPGPSPLPQCNLEQITNPSEFQPLYL